jgi:uracil-DNA glycosylase family 4
LDAALVRCVACPRLVDWRTEVARTKRRQFIDETYWGRPVAGFGPDDARMLIVGLAPAAHGANRTGRMFTGDRSGDWLYAALHRAGLASQPTSVRVGDGLTLNRTRITAAVHCAPPDNKPTPVERDTCRGWFARELALLWPGLGSVLVLGNFGWDALRRGLRANGLPSALPPFGHGVEAEVDGRLVVGCYHVSQQNTFTGRLTEAMLDAAIGRAAAAAAQ